MADPAPSTAKPRTRALILPGHGSQDNAGSSQATRVQADEIRRRGCFHEVVAALYKEEPLIGRSLDLVESDDVFVIPFAISDGYMRDVRWPRELGLEGSEMRVGDRRIFYGRALGTHLSMTHALRNCAEQCVRDSGHDLPPSKDLTLVLVGHGTKFSRHSRTAVIQQVEWLTKEGAFAEVLPAFLEEEPYDRGVLAKVKTSHVIVVPFFLGDGQHTTQDLPVNLGLMQPGEKTWKTPSVITPKEGHGPLTVWYSRTIGSDAWIANVILDRVHDIDPKAVEVIPATERWVTGTRRDHFVTEVQKRGEVVLGRLLVQLGKDGFSVRHEADRDVAEGRLVRQFEPEDAHEISRLAEDGKFRPMRSAANLRQGWFFGGLSREDLWAVVNLLMPGVVDHIFLKRDGTLRICSFEESARRRASPDNIVQSMEDGPVLEKAREVCARVCLKNPIWPIRINGKEPVISKAGMVGEWTIPCPEPCSVIMHAARAACKLAPKDGTKSPPKASEDT